MTAVLHPWWSGFGQPVAPDTVAPDAAQAVVAYVLSGSAPAVTLVGTRQTDDGAVAALHLEIEVERPQDLAAPVRSVEPLALVCGANGMQPAVLALRPDFPETMHQNWTPDEMPRALCVDDRPWAEAQLTFTPADFLRRVQLWLAKAARGELHDTAQPLDPLFFHNPAKIILPTAALMQANNPAELVGYQPQFMSVSDGKLVAQSGIAAIHVIYLLFGVSKRAVLDASKTYARQLVLSVETLKSA